MRERQLEKPARPLDPRGWVDEHGDYLFRYALTRVRQRQAAEDMVQETFLAALQAADRFRNTASERTWLVSILKHKIIDHMRRRPPEQPVSDLGSCDKTVDELFDRAGKWKKAVKRVPGPGAVFERQEFWEAFARCLGKLPERLARAFVLREVDELDSAAVCDVLHISANNLWVMLHRARVGLWRCLETNWFEIERTRQ